MTANSHDRPETASSKRTHIIVDAHEHPLLFQLIQNNPYLWPKTAKDVLEAALREGEIPVVLEPSPRTRPTKARSSTRNPKQRKEAASRPTPSQPQVAGMGNEEVAVGSGVVPAYVQAQDRSGEAAAEVQQPHREVVKEPEIAAATSVAEVGSSSEVQVSQMPESPATPEENPVIGSSIAGGADESEKARLRATLLMNLQQFSN